MPFARDDTGITVEAALDGFYVLRTSVPAETLDAGATVRAYKSLAQVERAFRSLKTVDLDIRPVFHWTAPRVRAHVFLCLLAYHLEWHLRQALAPMLFDDHDRAAAEAGRASAVAKAQPSAAAKRKAASKLTDDDMPVHSFRSLLADLATLTRNTVRFGRDHTTELLATPTENPTPRLRSARSRARTVVSPRPNNRANTTICAKSGAKFRLNFADPAGLDNAAAVEALSGNEVITYLDTPIGRRKAFANACSEGRGVSELKRQDPKAAPR